MWASFFFMLWAYTLSAYFPRVASWLQSSWQRGHGFMFCISTFRKHDERMRRLIIDLQSSTECLH